MPADGNDLYGLVASGLPPEMVAQFAGLHGRDAIARALLQQGLQDVHPPDVKGRFQGKISPWQGISQMAKAGIGGFMTGANAKSYGELAQQHATGQNAAVERVAQAMAPPPPQPAASPPPPPTAPAPMMPPPAMAAPPGGPNTNMVDVMGQYGGNTPMLEQLAAKQGGAPPGAPVMPPQATPASAPGQFAPDQNSKLRIATEAAASPYPRVRELGKMYLQHIQKQDDMKEAERVRVSEGELNRDARHQDNVARIEGQYDLEKTRLQMNLDNNLVTIDQHNKNRAQLEQHKQEAVALENKRHGALQKELKAQDIQGKKELKEMDIAAKAEAKTDKPAKPLPVSASQKLMENSQNLRRAEQALSLATGGVVKDQQGNVIAKGDKAATGLKGLVPDTVLQRWDPKGVETRAAIADLGSLIIHDRSGAAVTASETPRLKPFIPTVTDDAETAKKKLTKFVATYRDITEEATNFYRDSGYNVPELRGSGAAPDIAPSGDPKVMDSEMMRLLEKYK